MMVHLGRFAVVAGMLAATSPAAAVAEDLAGREGHEGLLLDARLTYGQKFEESVFRAVHDVQAGEPGGDGFLWVRALRTERPPAWAFPRVGSLLRANLSGNPPVFASFEELLRP